MERVFNAETIVEVDLVKEKPSTDIVWTNKSLCTAGLLGCSLKMKKHEWTWAYRPHSIFKKIYKSEEDLLKDFHGRIETTSRKFISAAFIYIKFANGTNTTTYFTSDEEAEKYYQDVLSLIPRKISL